MPKTARAPDPDNIEPFWSRLREISLYPLRGDALLTIGVLALCHLVRYLPFGWAFDIFVWIALYKYACECLRTTANGRLDPPVLSTTVEDSVGWDMIKLQAIIVIIATVGAVFLPPLAAIAIILLLTFAQPAASMSLAMDGSLGHALNPGTWFAVIGRLGSPYLAVVLLSFVFLASAGNLSGLLGSVMPGFIAKLINDFASHYVVIANFHLMGYMIWQYHREFGYDPVIQTPLDRPLSADERFLAETQQLVRDGHIEAALEQLREQLHSRGGTPELHEQYRKLLALGGHKEESLRHGREWIEILLAQEDGKRALDLARDCIALDPSFRPPADAINMLAERAAKGGQSQLAVSLLANFHRTHPKHKDLPANYLLAARLLGDRLGRDAEARKLTGFLLQNFPDHPLHDEIATYDRFLASIAASAKPPAAG
ncbi:MAG TPA: hypothetical protein PKO41_00365 [Dokdonella sp.]|uniref:hypothetical protein n=1 Tax=Dokdonella sp. TaxID=2291710 RepID=UPI0025C4F8A6|nr:hypothetical protein [Dokdonella sp.]MBX3691908.1 hypothetical protein [Dokdonella sp.]HNR90852.1 hypothetical protein [Dokdonella sp.]